MGLEQRKHYAVLFLSLRGTFDDSSSAGESGVATPIFRLGC